MSAHQEEPHLRLYKDRAVLVNSNGSQDVYFEGSPSEEARKRYDLIRNKLDSGWFEKFVTDVLRNPSLASMIDPSDMQRIKTLIENISSERGRALVGLFIVQLVVKNLAREQSIRLHKGGGSDFSWQEGLSMRSIDAQYITPVLRKHNLLLVNSYGVFMTRSLAENYPYTQFYKASIRGGKEVWLELVDRVEAQALDSEAALKYILACLANRTSHFSKLVEETLAVLNEIFAASRLNIETSQNLISQHIEKSTYSSRLLEVAAHSFLQALEELGQLEGKLSPLCQMRTANKKHRNVADVEIASLSNENLIYEAWDAKYGKPYLRDEIEELYEKISTQPQLKRAGFIVDREPDRRPDIEQRMHDIKEETGVEVNIFSLSEWVQYYMQNLPREVIPLVPEKWLKAYAETLCLRRREQAPIDEPAEIWVHDLKRILSDYVLNKLS